MFSSSGNGLMKSHGHRPTAKILEQQKTNRKKKHKKRKQISEDNKNSEIFSADSSINSSEVWKVDKKIEERKIESSSADCLKDLNEVRKAVQKMSSTGNGLEKSHGHMPTSKIWEEQKSGKKKKHKKRKQSSTDNKCIESISANSSMNSNEVLWKSDKKKKQRSEDSKKIEVSADSSINSYEVWKRDKEKKHKKKKQCSKDKKNTELSAHSPINPKEVWKFGKKTEKRKIENISADCLIYLDEVRKPTNREGQLYGFAIAVPKHTGKVIVMSSDDSSSESDDEAYIEQSRSKRNSMPGNYDSQIIIHKESSSKQIAKPASNEVEESNHAKSRPKSVLHPQMAKKARYEISSSSDSCSDSDADGNDGTASCNRQKQHTTPASPTRTCLSTQLSNSPRLNSSFKGNNQMRPANNDNNTAVHRTSPSYHKMKLSPTSLSDEVDMADWTPSENLKGAFTAEEDEILMRNIEQYILTDPDWQSQVAAGRRKKMKPQMLMDLCVGLSRPRRAVYFRARSLIHRKMASDATRWSVEDEQRLVQVVRRFSTDWIAVAKLMERTPGACRSKYRAVSDAGGSAGAQLRRGAWAAEEEDRLVQALVPFSRASLPFSWQHIHDAVGTRSAEQCRRHFAACGSCIGRVTGNSETTNAWSRVQTMTLYDAMRALPSEQLHSTDTVDWDRLHAQHFSGDVPNGSVLRKRFTDLVSTRRKVAGLSLREKLKILQEKAYS